MTVECCICSELLLKEGMQVSTTLCGHVYHSKCIRGWIQKNNNKGICPVCRAEFDPSRIIPLHILDDNETKTIDAIYEYVKHLERRDGESRVIMDGLLDALNKLNANVIEIKEDNLELKEKITKMEKDGFIGSSPIGEQLKAKDSVITALRREVQDLKNQRAHAAKEMLEIQNQIGELKKNSLTGKDERVPLKNTTNENQEPKAPITLSLKFDDVSDRMILGDF